MPYILQVAVGRRPHLNVFGNDYNTSDGTGDYFPIYITNLISLDYLMLVSSIYLFHLNSETNLKFSETLICWTLNFLNLKINSDKILFQSLQSNSVILSWVLKGLKFSNHSSFFLELELYSTVWLSLNYKLNTFWFT